MSDVSLDHGTMPHSHPSPRPPKPKAPPMIPTALQPTLSTLPLDLLFFLSITIEDLLSTSPKRWVVYPPMVLLPSGSFSSPSWTILLPNLSQETKTSLWTCILSSISKRAGKGVLTHLAVNSCIPLLTNSAEVGGSEENILRAPSGLIMLHGDFGPALSRERAANPYQKDFEEAFWASTKQNGVTQIWAPKWTMFSRGNVGEKGRVLGFGGSESVKGNSDAEAELAVDLYAGIGYFVFSYVKMGMVRVLGWELNPWSVEGLRRGAVVNGWSVRVVKHGEVNKMVDEKIVIFLEDNCHAKERMERLGGKGPVRHVNCGLLPTSRDSWEMALGMVEDEGWLHLHENVGVNDVESRKIEVEQMFSACVRENKDRRQADIEHVEYVKTFAPGVWHIVFDVHISRPSTNTNT